MTNEDLQDELEARASRRVPPRISAAEYDRKLAARRQTGDGSEIPDPVPMAPPIGFIEQPSMFERMRAMVKGELLRHAAEAAGAETFEEADDFDVPDELVPQSGFENDPEFDPPVPSPKVAPGEALPSSGPKDGPTSATATGGPPKGLEGTPLATAGSGAAVEAAK